MQPRKQFFHDSLVYEISTALEPSPGEAISVPGIVDGVLLQLQERGVIAPGVVLGPVEPIFDSEAWLKNG